MVDGGVKTGQYDVSNVEMGEETFGSNHMYMMTYNTSAGDLRGSSKLCVYFPKSEGNEHFFVAHYSATGPSNSSWSTDHVSDFEAMLASVSAR